MRTGAARVFPALFAAAVFAHAQEIDRIVAAIDTQPITRSDVEREYKLESFMNDGRLPAGLPAPQAFRQTLDRLIDQRLLTEEEPAEGSVRQVINQHARQQLEDLQKKVADPKAFQARLSELRMTQEDLLQRYEEQERILHLIDDRLRPEARVQDAAVQEYYRQVFVPEYAKGNKAAPAPPLQEVQERIQEILTQERIDQLLATWLAELRKAHHVRVISP